MLDANLRNWLLIGGRHLVVACAICDSSLFAQQPAVGDPTVAPRTRPSFPQLQAPQAGASTTPSDRSEANSFATPFGAAITSPAERQKAYEEIAAEVAILEREGKLLKRVVRLAAPTVVHIEAEINGEMANSRKTSVEEAGSGVILQFNQRHYVLTNRHVVRGAALSKINIKLYDGRALHPYRVWSDSASDVAVLAIDAPDLEAARLGSSDALEIGDFVLAIGSPFRLSHSVTYGIISAKGRRDLELGSGKDGVQLQDFLQTDAAINPGNSGGPLLNLRGEVVGINTAIASNSGGSEGIGFAIPIKMAANIAQQLIEKGTVSRAFLGVQLDSRFSAESAARLGLPRPMGTRVSGITAGSPAEQAGLLIGDVILELDGQKIEDDNHLVNLVGLMKAEATIPVLVFRDGKTTTVQVRLTTRSP